MLEQSDTGYKETTQTQYPERKQEEVSDCIDANAGQKVNTFYETFYSLSLFEVKLSLFYGKCAPKHRKSSAQQLVCDVRLESFFHAKSQQSLGWVCALSWGFGCSILSSEFEKNQKES